MPAISIVTPAYNAETYLAETVRSVLAQTFADFEMLIVDDGSTDRTAEIALSFAEQDSRIRVLRQVNAGISGARNAALAKSTAPVLALLDSDDIWFPTYLEQQVRTLETHPHASVVSANAINFGGPFDGLPLRRVPPVVQPISLQTLIEHEDSVCIMSVFRRELCERIGGFDPSLRSSEDYDFWLRAAVAGFTILFNGEPLGLYRRRTQSVSADDGRMLLSIVRVLQKTKEALADPTSAEAAAIDRQLDRFELAAVASAAKLALYNGDYGAAADGFATLARRRASLRLRVAALAARYAPNLLLLAHRTRTSLRRRQPFAAAGAAQR